MTYAMTLDNSWEMMSEDEMYDVNGGSASSWDFHFTNESVVALFGAAASLGIVALKSALVAGLFYISLIPVVGKVLYGMILKSIKPIALAMATAIIFGTEFYISISNRKVLGVKVPTGISFGAT